MDTAFLLYASANSNLASCLHEFIIEAKSHLISNAFGYQGTLYFPSTAHPLFLTPNLTQEIVILKGLKNMAEDPLYAEYARVAAADIWERLLD
jgi:hypothetical protein